MLALLACAGEPPRELDQLVVQDSTYLDPGTMQPFSGPVIRHFQVGGPPQLEATLRDGTWEGEMTIYHETGKVRYQGPMSRGVRCGAWTQNEEPREPEDLYSAIKEDLESLVLYPECP